MSWRKGGDLTGPNPVDRGKPGSKLHVISDRAGLPLAVLVTTANGHDSQLLLPMLDCIPGIRTPAGDVGGGRPSCTVFDG